MPSTNIHSKPHRTDPASRMQAINAALLKAGEARGYAIGYERSDRKSLVIHGEHVTWRLYERSAQRKVPLTKKELKDPFNSVQAQRGWKEVLVPSGRLGLIIEAEHHGTARVAEHSARPFEGRINKILAKFEKVAAEAAANRKWCVERERRYFERQMRIDERSRLEDIENRKRHMLGSLANDWAEAERLRRFIDRVDQQHAETPDLSGRVGPWLAWAHSHVDALDPLAGGTDSFLERLFPPEPTEYELEFGEPEEDGP